MIKRFVTTDTLNRIRAVAHYSVDHGLVERLQKTEHICQEMRQALNDAIAEIERLQAQLQEVRQAVIE